MKSRPALARPSSARLASWSGCAALAATVVAALLWLVDAAGRGAPSVVDRAAVVVALLAGVVWAAAAAHVAWHRPGPERTARRWLVVLLLLAAAVRLAGIGWEVGQGYYRDEGIYHAAAQEINGGELLPESFIYGHLPYYLVAFVLWVEGLAPELFARLCGFAVGAATRIEVQWTLIRLLSVACGALTVLPVFVLARRIGGLAAGVLGGLAIVFSPLYNEVAHVFISDVPAAFFAALTLLFVGRLLDAERAGDYALAGVCAGLAAGCKYPAGVVAVAIVGVWAWWRVRRRDWRLRGGWGLPAAGAAAIAAFLAVMPALPVHAASAFANEGKDLFFGIRQYARGGWIGVQPPSIAGWYGAEIVASFGLPAVLLAAAGLFRLDRRRWSRLAAAAVFPIVYLGLLASMSMVVKRNLQPVLPALAALVGVGVAAWWPVARRLVGRRAVAAAVLGVVALGLPAARTLGQDLRWSRQSTREAALAWIEENVPAGTVFVRESYAPRLPRSHYTWAQRRFVGRMELDDLRDPRYDYLLVAGPAFARFLQPELWSEPHHEVYAGRYREIFDSFPLVREWHSSWWRDGPYLALYRIDPEEIEYRTERRFDAAGPVFFSRRNMRPERRGPILRFPRGPHFVAFRDYFEPGRYRVRVEAELAEGRPHRLVVNTREGEEIADTRLRALGGPGGPRATVRLPGRGKYTFAVYLPWKSTLSAVEVERVEGAE